MDIASKADVTHGCISHKKKSNIPRLISILLLQLLISCLSATTVFAGKDNVDTGGEEDNENGQTLVSYGISRADGGYRTYMEDSGGSIVSPIVDVYLNGDPVTYHGNPIGIGSANYGTGAVLGGTSNAIKANNTGLIKEYFAGLLPPFSGPFGDELNNWFESDFTEHAGMSGAGLTNADAWIFACFYPVTDAATATEYIKKYEDGEYRIVVEALYWYDVVDYNCKYVETIAGTCRDIARYNQGNKDIQNTGGVGGGPWLGVLTNDQLCTALIMTEVDEFSGLKPPNNPGSNIGGEGGRLSYNDILADKTDGWGTHVVYVVKNSEMWFTNDASQVGGPTEPSPGNTPLMGNPGNGIVVEIIRPVTVVKHYEQINTRADGSTYNERVAGPYQQLQICRTIQIQNEAGASGGEWNLTRWFTSNNQGVRSKWELYDTKRYFTSGTRETIVFVGKKTNSSTEKVQEDIDHLYILHTKEGDKEDPPPDIGEGLDMVLYQSEISKAYITNQIKDNTEPEFKFTWENPELKQDDYCYTETGVGARPESGTPGKPGYVPADPGHDEEKNHNFQWQDDTLNLVLKLDDTRFNTYKNIMGTVDPFKTKLNDENENHKTGDFSVGDAGNITEKTLEDFSAKFVVWRGKDQPTITAYKPSPGDSGAVDSLLDKTSADNTDQGERKHSDGMKPEDMYYKENLSIFFKVDDSNGNYDLKTDAHCPKNHTSQKTVLDTTPADSKYEFKGPVTVHFYDDYPQAVVSSFRQTAPLRTGGASYTGGILTGNQSVIQRSGTYDEMTFYPYVQMSYQTTDDAGTTDGGIVYVLSSYERGFRAKQTMRLTWKVSTYPGTGYSMLLRSDQWSTHATALEKYGKNMLLPGGAIYQLTSNGGAGVGKLGFTLTVEAWYPDIDQDYEDGITNKDADWNGQNGLDEFRAFMSTARSNLGGQSRIEMRVARGQQKDAISGLRVSPGADLSTVTTRGLTASTETKYYLKSTDPNAADSIKMKVGGNPGGLAGEYKIEALPDGKINVTGGGTIAKNQGASAIGAGTGAGKADIATSELQNFVASLSRNVGNDKDTTFGDYWAKEDGTWYNESFGVKMNYYSGTVTLSVPENDGIGLGGVTAVLDPNLCPAHTSTQTKFQSVNTAQFFVVVDNPILGSYGGVQIPLPGYGGYLMASQPFYIADFTVQDND